MLNRLHKIQSEREVTKMEMLNQPHKLQPENVVKGNVANSKSDVENELKTRLEKVRGLKWYLNVKVEMVRDIDNGKKEKARYLIFVVEPTFL